MHGRSLPIVALAALALAPLAPAAGPRSPCSLATTADVKLAFGGTVAAGRVDRTLPSAPTCHFAVTGSNLGIRGEAVVFETPGQTPQTFALARKYVPGAVAVSGVGAPAFYNPHSTSLELLKGTTVAVAQGIFLNPGGPQPSAARVKADVVVFAKAVAKHV